MQNAIAHVNARNICVGFGPVQVMEDQCLNIEKGEFLVLLGASGCGKSTLLSTIARLQDAKSGQIWINGQNGSWREPKDRGIAMVFQS